MEQVTFLNLREQPATSCTRFVFSKMKRIISQISSSKITADGAILWLYGVRRFHRRHRLSVRISRCNVLTSQARRMLASSTDPPELNSGSTNDSSFRSRLLDAARGGTQSPANNDDDNPRRLRCFPLYKHDIHPKQPQSPSEFHSRLCELIRKANKRIQIASLYIGPAAGDRHNVVATSSDPVATMSKEADFLRTLHGKAKDTNVQIQVLLDFNRSLRQVPVSSSSSCPIDKKDTTFITSAEACLDAIFRPTQPNPTPQHGVHLLSVLSETLQQPPKHNPLLRPLSLKNLSLLREIFGVFHMKVYIFDDTDLIISGANLSEEYFTDRIDRYFHVTRASTGEKSPARSETSSSSSTSNNEPTMHLIDFCSAVLQSLVDHAAVPYMGPEVGDSHELAASLLAKDQGRRQALLTSLQKLFLTSSKDACDPDSGDDDDDLVAYAVPTIQIPKQFFSNCLLSDRVLLSGGEYCHEDVLGKLIYAASTVPPGQSEVPLDLRFATAYMNPTSSLLSLLQHFCSTGQRRVFFLTAGSLSHGFKPKTKYRAGNVQTPGVAWIPRVFDYIANQIEGRFPNVTILYYQRLNWTFHAKGMWLTTGRTGNADKYKNNVTGGTLNANIVETLAVICGSGNFGQRSADRDMEFNLIMILPTKSSLNREQMEEWNRLCAFAGRGQKGGRPFSLRETTSKIVTPWIRRFF